MHVVWSNDAITDYHQNIDYLMRKWSEKIAIEFIEDLEVAISLIKSHPELYPLTDYQKIRKATIRKQITLFYKVVDNEIHLIRVWNNFQDPEKLKF